MIRHSPTTLWLDTISFTMSDVDWMVTFLVFFVSMPSHSADSHTIRKPCVRIYQSGHKLIQSNHIMWKLCKRKINFSYNNQYFSWFWLLSISSWFRATDFPYTRWAESRFSLFFHVVHDEQKKYTYEDNEENNKKNWIRMIRRFTNVFPLNLIMYAFDSILIETSRSLESIDRFYQGSVCIVP